MGSWLLPVRSTAASGDEGASSCMGLSTVGAEGWLALSLRLVPSKVLGTSV